MAAARFSGSRARAVVIALVATAMAAALVLVAPATGGQASGQVAPAVADEFTAGSGTARADLLTPTVAAGNLAITVIIGSSAAGYRDRNARGTATLVDVPVLKIASAAPVCGQPAPDLLGALPPAVIANTAANADTESVVAASPTQGQLYDQVAEAHPAARSSSATSLGSLEIPLIVGVAGARATTATSADASTLTRTATANSTMGEVSILGGVVKLHGLQWDLQQSQVGADSRADEESASGSFTMGSISFGLPGLPRQTFPVPSPDQLAPVVAQVNTLLAPLGLQLRLPEVTSNPDAGSHAVSPLTIAIGGSQWVLSPLLAALLNSPYSKQATQQLTDVLFDAEDCNQLGGIMKALGPDFNALWNTLGSSAPLLTAVLSGALGGTGEIQVSVGGVTTSLENAYYPKLNFAPPAFGTPRPAAPGTAGTAGTPGTPGAPAAVPAPAPAAPPVDTTTGAAPAMATSTECQTTSPAGRPGCWLGRGTAGAALAGLFTTSLLVADETLRRRRSAALVTKEEGLAP